MIKTSGYIIEKNSEFGYTLSVKGDYKYEIYFSISTTKILPHSYYDEDNNTLIFTAEKVEILSNYLDYKRNGKIDYFSSIKLIHNLTKQINYLYSNNFGFYGFDLDDIIVINQTTFLIASSNYLLPIIDKSLIFYSPIKFPYFSNPELFNLTKLPGEINYKCCYYSLGVLVLYCLLNNYLLVGNEIKTSQEIEKGLMPIKNTKMYWFLKRCLTPITTKRILLFF
jgi:hypothetical protein